VDDNERDVDRLLVSKRTLPAQAVSPGHFAVVGGEDDNRSLGEAQRIEFGQDTPELDVHGPDRVDVEVIEAPPAGLLERDVAQDAVPHPEVLSVRLGAAPGVERLP